MCQEGFATRIEPIPWDNDKALYIAPHRTEIEHRTYKDLDRDLNEFVGSARASGYDHLRKGNREEALNYFDRARRVSNELDDYVRIAFLEPNEMFKKLWLDWVARQYPDVNHLPEFETVIEEHAKQLGVL